MKKMPSRFEGTCKAPACQKGNPHIDVSEMIYWHKDGNGSKVWHVDCAEAMAAGKIPSNLPVGHGIVTAGPTPVPPAGAAPSPVSPAPAAPPAFTPGPSTPPPSVGPSCADCPNLVPPNESQSVWSAPVDSYTCKARGIIVTAPGADIDELDEAGQQIAASCMKFGVSHPKVTDHVESRVGASSHVAAAGALKASSCSQCKNYAQPNIVKGATGWGVGMCTAMGKLILPEKMVNEALNCGMSDAGTPDGDVSKVTLLPRFTTTIVRVKSSVNSPGAPSSGGATPAAPTPVPNRIKLRRKHAVDPREYETDAPVSEADEANFIRAWRIVEDPEGYGEPIKLPIFDGPRLMATECTADDHTLCNHDPRSTYGNHRPDLYVDHNDMLYQLASVMVRHDYVPLAEGPSGTGKTECMVWWAYILDLPVQRIAIDKGTEVYHLSGEKELVVDETTGQTITSYKMGRFAAWYGRSCVIIVDEGNLKADVWEFLRPTADGAKRLDLDDAQGIAVSRGPRTFVAFTQNPSWDPMYLGTEPISAADLQRVAPFWFDYPDEEVEREIILAHCRDGGYELPPRTLDQIMQISSDIRNMQESIGLPWGVRSNIKVAKFSESFRLPVAYRRAVLDGQESSVVELISQSINSVVV